MLASPASASQAPLVDPFALPYTLGLCEAIERFSAASVALDPARFRIGGADLRYVVERHLYFALVADRRLYRYFVARECGTADNDGDTLSDLAGLVAPYFSHQPPAPPGRPRSQWTRFLRFVYRHFGRSTIRRDGTSGRMPKVLFLVIQPKLVRYFRPIAAALSPASAFLAVDDPQMFKWLETEGLPRVGIELTPKSRERRKPCVKAAGFEYLADPFDDLAINFNALRRALTALDPDCIVVPEGNAPINELVNRVAKTLLIPTLCIQQGWAPVVHTGFRNMSYTAMCVWGHGFADLLVDKNPDQHFVVTGNHVVMCRRREDGPSRNAIAFFLQKGSHLITETAWDCMLELIAWTARHFPDREVRVREHPSAPLTASEIGIFAGLPNVRLSPPEQDTLNDALAGCRIAVSMYSTTLLEAAATGAVPLILNVNGFDHYSPNIAADGGAVEVRDFAAARTALSRLVLDDEYWSSFAAGLDRVRQRFFARNRDEALAAIVAEIEKLGREPRSGKRQRC